MDAFLASTAAVTLAEMGDKTQLLTLFLMVRYRQPLTILTGILLATLVNHWLSAWLGIWAAQWLDPRWTQLAIGISFIALALWLLVPDKLEPPTSLNQQWSPLLTTTVLFFLAEIGDKTQVATIVLAAHHEQLTTVVIGTTLGMLLANAPMLLVGEQLLQRLPLGRLRLAAFALFTALGLWSLSPWWTAWFSTGS